MFPHWDLGQGADSSPLPLDPWGSGLREEPQLWRPVRRECLKCLRWSGCSRTGETAAPRAHQALPLTPEPGFRAWGLQLCPAEPSEQRHNIRRDSD